MKNYSYAKFVTEFYHLIAKVSVRLLIFNHFQIHPWKFNKLFWYLIHLRFNSWHLFLHSFLIEMYSAIIGRIDYWAAFRIEATVFKVWIYWISAIKVTLLFYLKVNRLIYHKIELIAFDSQRCHQLIFISSSFYIYSSEIDLQFF